MSWLQLRSTPMRLRFNGVTTIRRPSFNKKKSNMYIFPQKSSNGQQISERIVKSTRMKNREAFRSFVRYY